MSFRNLQLTEPLLKAIQEQGYSIPTEIQEKAIPIILNGSDLLANSPTGTGKTAAFILPLLHKCINASIPNAKGAQKVKTLVLAPTRELALQISVCITNYSRYSAVKHCVIYGGVSQDVQVKNLARGVDILVATPGRLLDLMQQGFVDMSAIEHFVLDEADRMLDSGFLNDIKKIVKKLPVEKQTLLFSATLPIEIRQLSGQILRNPKMIHARPVSSATGKIDQSVYYVERHQKHDLLLDLLDSEKMDRVLVFTTMKHHADKIAKRLKGSGVSSAAIHGNKSQRQRQDALEKFKSRGLRVLVATDVVARGIDIDDLTHVINFELPQTAETYIHRIGRTGRKGKSGTAISFCASDEKSILKEIQSLMSLATPVAPLIDLSTSNN